MYELKDIGKKLNIDEYIEGILNDFDAGITSKRDTIQEIINLCDYCIKKTKKS